MAKANRIVLTYRINDAEMIQVNIDAASSYLTPSTRPGQRHALRCATYSPTSSRSTASSLRLPRTPSRHDHRAQGHRRHDAP